MNAAPTIKPGRANLAASIRARLLNKAKRDGEDFSFVLNRFGIERFLYRLAQTAWRDKFLLKGALLFDLWFDEPHRPTRDADFLGFGPQDAEALKRAVTEICDVRAYDGIKFDRTSITIDDIREDARYGGLRVRLVGNLDGARCNVQLDVGYGDAVTPRPKQIEYPSMLDDLPSAKILAYPRETVFSEKLEAIVSLGIANSRMKDFYDLRALIHEGGLDEEVLPKAIGATFARRRTTIPADIPMGLSEAFAADKQKVAQWRAFLSKNKLDAPTLADVMKELRLFVAKPFKAAAEETK